MAGGKGKREHQKDWLEAYLQYGTQHAACQATGTNQRTVARWRKEAKFCRAVDEVKRAIADDLEEHAIKRAKEGSDNLLIFLLKGHKPEKFRERYENKNTHEAGDSLQNLLANLPSTMGPPKRRAGTEEDE